MKIIFKVHILISLSVALTQIGVAQNMKRLSINDQFPYNVLVSSLEKKYGSTVEETDFNNKIILLDFWNIWCSTCWKGMEKLESLQKQFQDELIIVKITSNKTEDVENAYKKLNKKPPAIMSITEDSIFNKYFPRLGDPLHVWVDKNKNIKHITYAHNATKENIAAFIRGEELPFALRGNLGIGEHLTTLFEKAATTLKRNITGYSLFVTGYNEYAALNSYENKDINFKPNLLYVNTSLKELFKDAYFRDIYDFEKPKYFNGSNRLVLKLKDSTAFKEPVDSNLIDLWNKQFRMSYELFIPKEQKVDPLEILKQDLERNFPFIATVETFKVPCMVLIWIKEKNNKKAEIKKEGLKKLMEPKTYNEIVSKVHQILENNSLHFVSDVAIDKNISFFLPSGINDFITLKKELEYYGLTFVKEIRDVKMLVIKDK